jgi:hypothetical protein
MKSPWCSGTQLQDETKCTWISIWRRSRHQTTGLHFQTHNYTTSVHTYSGQQFCLCRRDRKLSKLRLQFVDVSLVSSHNEYQGRDPALKKRRTEPWVSPARPEVLKIFVFLRILILRLWARSSLRHYATIRKVAGFDCRWGHWIFQLT